jgi:uncharacterized protein
MTNSLEGKLFVGVTGIEWDETKRKSNISKHGIDFVDAAKVFQDPSQYTYRSPNMSDESRYVSVGLVREILAAVVFVRRGNRLRIISARRARHKERELYG